MRLVQIRPLTNNDLPGLHQLTLLSEAEGFRFLRRFEDEWTADADYVAASSNLFLGVVIEDQLVAVGGITPDPYVRDPAVGRVRHMYVHPAHRQRGIGHALLQELERFAWTQFRQLRLRTDTARAATFYVAAAYRWVDDPTATHVRDRTFSGQGGGYDPL